MQLTARDIASLTGGTLAGNPDIIVTGVAGIKEAQPGDVTFVAHPKYAAALKTTRASVILLPPAMDADLPATRVLVGEPMSAFAALVQKISPPPIRHESGIHPTAVIHSTATLGQAVSIQPHVIIEAGVVIGDNTLIGAGSYIGHGSTVGANCHFYPRVTLREHTVVGDRVILHTGVVLGADGFGYELKNGAHQKIPQLGNVAIGANVEIGANTTIDRARFGTTRIGKGTKIDNLVQIGHNCVIGEHCIVCGLVGMAGSTIVGNYVTIAGQVGIAGHLTIGDKSIIMAQAGVTKDVPPGSLMLGSPAVPHKDFKKINAATQRLPEKLRHIEEELATLRARLSHSA
ncbi:MAG: UDP-3-O-acylglucosamine N-acyltransferase [Verrucomicrobiae bacterium]|nr:UDP-3-O-acylglucosamine N-acyltransferase [Verrucomicrobiae bacterium]